MRPPVVGRVASVAVDEPPWIAVVTLALHVLASTVQVWPVPTQLRLDEHDLSEPPSLPLQLHVYGPVPLTAVALPLLHRLVVGALVVLPPSADPQAPSTAVTQVPAPEPVHVPWLQV